MTYEMITDSIAQVHNDQPSPILFDGQSALDLLASARYACDCDALVILKEDVAEDFFDLKTGIAGEILQKFVNYGFSVAIVGDFSHYTSKSLRDFLYESNKGHRTIFADSVADAIAGLTV